MNDLSDLMYLTTAAGYADHVVGDKSTIAQLRQAQRRVTPRAQLHRRLADLAAAL